VTPRVARVSAHAKINVRLKVLGREPGGYHSLETIFARVALADTVTVRVGNRTHGLRVTGDETLVAAVGPAESNVALRAATTYAEVTGWPLGFEIEIEKRIPVRAGLGGGSADAAAVLTALQALSPEPVARDDLLRIAASLGADVPFLVTGHGAALAWGRGDRMLPLPELPERTVLLLTPRFSVSTREAYSWLDATSGGEPAPPVEIESGALSDWTLLAAYAENDFEVPVISRHPEIAEMLAALSGAGAVISRMSGSGSTGFGVFAGDARGEVLPGGGERWEVRSTHTLARVVPPELTE
jgi:4-diphosphocytidyl-2-C-methyl-D-erythritol kinase